MKLKIPDGWRVPPDAMRKAIHREPRTEPARVEFDEARLLELMDQAEAMAGAHAAIDKQRGQALDAVRDLERQIGWLEGRAGALDGEAADDDQAQLERLHQRLEAAQRRLDHLDQQWEASGKRLKSARALAERLKRYAADELGWVPPGASDRPTTN
ncbi:ATPase AAA-2 [Thioalkalivibrio sp. K90mix]|uniref:ATPase AAA n=1 Tax=Thioalkalivibrio sp. (strain K90mix) TaxID=396595 RepID=UPI000195A3DA|nr:ATPase AAA [Thioalkalivibrio sp. K90mix]ADC71744.1 ATPase AAA-2 [Thioalkalivibrio sp. K90mix]